MGKKNNFKNQDGIVFSTNPDFQFQPDSNQESDAMTPAYQKLRVMIDRKKRKGKEVTLVSGYIGSEDDLKELGKMLKSKCGVGGTVKDGEILIQGNQRDKIVQLLLDAGYHNTKKAGG